MIQYFYTFWNDHHEKSSCHLSHKMVSHHYWLYSPYQVFHTWDSFILLVPHLFLSDLWVYHPLMEDANHDSTAVPFNLAESLQEKARGLSSCSSHAKHLQVPPCIPPRLSQAFHSINEHHPGSDADKQIQLNWLLQQTRTRLNFLYGTRNSKVYQLAGRLPWELC